METQDTSDTTTCNTNSRGRCWILTWNNYSESDLEWMRDFVKTSGTFKDYAFQEERGEEGTKHLQIALNFKNPRTFKTLKNKFPKCHIERAKNWLAARAYCLKDETRNGISVEFEKYRPKDPLEGRELRDWQEALLRDLDEEPDDRTIVWVADFQGGAGKTTLAKHLCIKYPDKVLYVGGKSADVKYGIFSMIKSEKIPKIVLWDLTRSIEGFVSWQGIEEVKNGIFYNTKYESEMCVYDCPHVVVFANFLPDVSKLSSDRWKIIELDDESRTDYAGDTDLTYLDV